jgi:hypothetical protein
VQVFAFLALLSGALTAHAQFAGLARRAPSPPASAPERAAAAEPPAIGPGARAAAAAPEAALPSRSSFEPMLTPMLTPVEPSRPAGVLSRSLKPRVAGLWVVDAAGGADSDATGFADVLASAKDGDVVFVRSGHYSEKILLAGSITLRGTGADRGAVVIDSDGPLTAAVGRGSVRIEHLTLTNSGPVAATALAVSTGAALTLVDAEIAASQGAGLRVNGGSVEAQDVRLSGRIALVVDGSGRAAIARGEVAGTLVGALLDGDGASGEFVKTRFHDGTRQVMVQRKARASVSGCDLDFTPGTRNNLGSIIALAGARVSATDTRIHLNRAASVGLAAQNGAAILATRVTVDHSGGFGAWVAFDGSLTLTDSAIEDNDGCAIMAENARLTLKRATLRGSGYGVILRSRVAARADESRFEGFRFGSLAAYRGDESLLALSGRGNVGVQMSPAGLVLMSKAAPRPVAAAGGAPPAGNEPPADGGQPRRPTYSAAETYDPDSKPVLLR